jgi:hypothetical protein
VQSGELEDAVMIPLAGLLRALTLALMLFLPAAALAEDVGTADAGAMRSAIQGQIDAFGRDDGTAAYSFAAPGIKAMFPNEGIFMDMVRQQYQPVYRPKSVTFGDAAIGPSGPMQKVFLVGPDGKNYVAVYTFQRQPDGSWKISGCYIVPDDGATI